MGDNEQLTVSQRKRDVEQSLLEAKRQVRKDAEFVRINRQTAVGPPGGRYDKVNLDNALEGLKAKLRESEQVVHDLEAQLAELDAEWEQNLEVWEKVEAMPDVLTAAVTQSWETLLEAAKAGDEEAVLTAADELVTARARVQVLSEVHDFLLR